MNDKKIVFTDLDGTLLNDEHLVSSENKTAMNAALNAGHKIVIATGRPIASAKILAKELGLVKEGCYIIASNGAVLYDAAQDKILQHKGLPLKYVRPLFESAYEDGLHVHTYSDDRILSERDTPEIRWYEKTIRVPALIVDDAVTHLRHDPVKVLLINFQSKEILVRFQQKMADWERGKVTSVFSNDIMLEYCPLGVTKGNAVKELCSLLSIPIAQSIAAGDEQNDISMIRAAGVGCVMCNGSEETKESADYITKNDNNHSGFAEILERFCL